MSQADTRGAGLSPHVLQMRELGEAPAGRGRACEGHFCGQVWGQGLQGAGDPPFHPSLLLPQEGPRHGCCLAGCPGPPSSLPRLHPGLTLWPFPRAPGSPAGKTLRPVGGQRLWLRGCASPSTQPEGGSLSSPFYR